MSSAELETEVAFRLYEPCPNSISRFGEDPQRLVYTCPANGRFCARCCYPMDRIVYVHGACSNNGRDNAKAGIGIAFGTRMCSTGSGSVHQFSLPVDDSLDVGRRTNQRAALLAALEGLKRVCNRDFVQRKDFPRSLQSYDDVKPTIIITTHSEYVVKGMTELLPRWKSNNNQNSRGTQPANFDLFLELERVVEGQERRHNCQVKFWQIAKEYNGIASKLAREAADSREG